MERSRQQRRQQRLKVGASDAKQVVGNKPLEVAMRKVLESKYLRQVSDDLLTLIAVPDCATAHSPGAIYSVQNS